MRKLLFFSSLVFLISCTSNTILKKPDDLIPKDTMVLLLKDMFIATSSKYINNKNLEKNVDYMPIVYKKYKIDSGRFQRSNLYYMSKIDDYKVMFDTVHQQIKKDKEYYSDLKKREDSIRKDSINKALKLQYQQKDSIKKSLLTKDSLKGFRRNSISKDLQKRVDSIRNLIKKRGILEEFDTIRGMI